MIHGLLPATLFFLYFCVLVPLVPLIDTVVQWLALWPSSERVSGSIPRPVAFLCGVCTFSPCVCGFSVFFPRSKNIHVRQSGTCELPGVCLRMWMLVCLSTRTCDKLPTCVTPPSPSDGCDRLCQTPATLTAGEGKWRTWMDGLPVITAKFPQGRSWVKQEKLQAKRKTKNPAHPRQVWQKSKCHFSSFCHINTSCSMQAIHFMTRFFIPHEISLMNIEMQYWNFHCRNIPQHSASPCSHWTVFFSWFVMVTFRATILPNNNSCVNISNGCERYLQLMAHANDAHSLVNTMAMKKACGHFDPKHSICAENALDHLDWMLWTAPQVFLSSAPRSCFLSRLPRVSLLHYSRLLYKGCACSSSVLLR